MPSQNLSFASLFSGCGGFDLGFIQRGFRSFGAYDYDADACSNFATNIRGEIHQVDLTNGIPNEAAIRGVEVLIAGPPCQGFSTVGKRRLNDERNHLLKLTGTLALRVMPKILIVENVAGVLAGSHLRYWRGLDDIMRLGGYRTHTIRCQASDLGMAQLRQRVLLIAWRTNRDLHIEPPRIQRCDLGSALAGVDRQANHNPNLINVSSRDWLIAKRIKPGQKLCNVRGGPNAVPTWDIPEVFGSVSEQERTVLELLRRLRRQNRQRENGDADPVSIRRLEASLGRPFRNLLEGLLTKGYLRRIGNNIDLAGTFNGKFRRMSWDKPACTVDTRFGSHRYFLHPTEQRGFTVREAARIQGFDDSYLFHGAVKAQFRLIGNAVPPPLGAFAADIARRLL